MLTAGHSQKFNLAPVLTSILAKYNLTINSDGTTMFPKGWGGGNINIYHIYSIGLPPPPVPCFSVLLPYLLHCNPTPGAALVKRCLQGHCDGSHPRADVINNGAANLRKGRRPKRKLLS